MDYSDQQLVVNYIAGDEKSLEILIKRYLKSIYGFVYCYVGDKQEAEDITQEVFIRVWRNLKKFDQNKNFKTWIFSIAKNASFDWLKKKKTIPFSNFENKKGENLFAEMLTDPALLPDKVFEQVSVAETLNTTINQLSSKYRTVLFLYYNDHFNFREIAGVLNESINTIKSRHLRALVLLKNLLLVRP